MEQKKKAALLLVGFSLVVGGIVIANYVMKGSPENEEKTSGNVYTDVPDAEKSELSESKSDAYRTHPEASRNIEDYWNDCEDEYAEAHPEEDSPAAGTGGSTEPARPTTSEDLFGSASGQAPARSGGGGSSSNPYRESAREREARHQRRREEAIDLANQMSGQNRDVEPEEDTPAEQPAQTITIPSGEVRRSGVISSLDDSWSDGGVSSLDESSPQASADDGMHPFKCMFVREEKIKSGQRVSVRLLEDIVAGGVLIPKNSHLMASCSLNARLELEIANVEIHGRIISLGYEAYDTDGTKGIYCPDAGDAGRTAKNKATSLAGTTLSSRVGRLASDVVSTGVSLIESASGERTVTVPAGYAFYIVRKKQL